MTDNNPGFLDFDIFGKHKQTDSTLVHLTFVTNISLKVTTVTPILEIKDSLVKTPKSRHLYGPFMKV